MTIRLISLTLQALSSRGRTPPAKLEERFKQQKKGVIQEMTLNERYCDPAKRVISQERTHTQT